MSDIVLAQINLYDARLRKESDVWTLRNAGFALGICLLVMGGWAILAQTHKSKVLAESSQIGAELQETKDELKRSVEQLASHQPDARLEQQLQAAKAKLVARSEVLEVLRQGLAPETIKPADVMRGFAHRVPSGLWLTGFRLNRETSLLEISGRTTDPALIPSYTKLLGEEKAFVGRTFAALEISDGKQTPAFHEFKLSSMIEPDGAPPKERALYEFNSGNSLVQSGAKP